jgi:signal transduction histidine kinase
VTALLTLQYFALRLKESQKLSLIGSQKIEALALSNQQINKNLEVPVVMRALVESALKLTEASDGAAGLMKNGQMVFTEYYKNGKWVPIDFTSPPPGYGVPGWVIENMRPYLSNDAESDMQVIQEIREQLGFYNLLDVCKIKSGRPLLLEKAPAKLSRLIEGLVQNHQRETDQHRVILNTDNPNLLLRVDAGRITQVIDNLLSNAIKYSPKGGEIQISCQRKNIQIEISVEDYGLGMSEDQIERIFDKFYRADISNTALGGLGLGMNITKSVS